MGYSTVLEYIDVDTWKLTQVWDGGVPTGVETIKLQTRDGGTVLKPQWQALNLPVFRAQCKLTFETVTREASVSHAPYWAPDLNHNTGWWVQTTDQASALAYWLAQQVAKPLPVVEGVQIVPDARLQLGDKIQVSDRHRTGVSITGVITRIRHELDHSSHVMTVRLLVLEVRGDNPTLADYDAVWGTADLRARDTTWANSTLAQFDDDPLRR